MLKVAKQTGNIDLDKTSIFLAPNSQFAIHSCSLWLSLEGVGEGRIVAWDDSFLPPLMFLMRGSSVLLSWSNTSMLLKASNSMSMSLRLFCSATLWASDLVKQEWNMNYLKASAHVDMVQMPSKQSMSHKTQNRSTWVFLTRDKTIIEKCEVVRWRIMIPCSVINQGILHQSEKHEENTESCPYINSLESDDQMSLSH